MNYLFLDDLLSANDTLPNESWLSGGGECCGFDAWVEDDQIKFDDVACGRGSIWKGSLPVATVIKAAKSINLDNLVFDNYGEVEILIDQNIYFVIDQEHPNCFNLRRKV
jgi:hypothetical protein